MKAVNIHEAKTHLSRLVEEAAKGEPFIIAKAGRAMVKVVPINEPVVKTPQRFDFLPADFTVPDNFDRLYEDEIAEMFYGKE
ncbi:type II toxin-antitoxin system Phd/YefM family antitoxin [Asticcacaulis sp.]|uniref:type II toxin-antitoxin system Phd/YefM family antitoxin n=1 Tax=Asticcacaulis sp. TaxID=1872648 RepID=UPI003F7C8A73